MPDTLTPHDADDCDAVTAQLVEQLLARTDQSDEAVGLARAIKERNATLMIERPNLRAIWGQR